MIDRELTKAVEPYLKQEDEGKFRCKTCQKLFKATSFVEKHIANKHSELVKHLEDVSFSLARLYSSGLMLCRLLISIILPSTRITSSHLPIHPHRTATAKPRHHKPMAYKAHRHITEATLVVRGRTMVAA